MQTWCLIGVLAIGQVDPEVTTDRPGPAGPTIPQTSTGAGSATAGMSADGSGPFWVSAEFLYGWVRGGRVPPLVTAGTGADNPGILGQPGTRILFGGDRLNDEPRSGVRLTAGAWLDCDQTCGVVARFYALCGAETNGLFGDPPVSRPFFDAATGRPLAELVALAGVVQGTVATNTETDPLCGADLAFRKLLCCGCNFRIDGLIGYRYLHFADRIEVTEDLATVDPLFGATRFRVNDRFEAANDFHGLDVGLQARYWWDAWSVDVLGRVAPGWVCRDVRIDGSTAAAAAGQPPVVRPGGLLALPSNIGRYETSEFTIVSELGVGVGYQVAPGLRARLGYTFLYWPKVARAGDQIDLAVNPNLLPPAVPGGPARPAFTGKTDDLWMHALSIGVEYSF